MTPECPRCGYDQSGVIDSWKESCPLTGTCSECGLEMEWALVIRPELRPVVPGFYEHAKHWWNLRWAWRTWTWCILPWRFAARVRLEHRPRVGLVLLWLLVLVVPLHLAASACRGGVQAMNMVVYGGGPIRLTWWWMVDLIAEPIGYFEVWPTPKTLI